MPLPTDPNAQQPQTEQEADALWDQLASERRGSAAKADVPEEPTPPVVEQPAVAATPAPSPPSLDDVLKAMREQQAVIAELTSNQRTMQGALQTATGRVAALQSALDIARRATPAAADTPTDKQATAALKSPEKWAKFKKEFPEFAEAYEELISANIAPPEQQTPPVDLAAVQAASREAAAQAMQVREEGYVERVHPGWKSTINTPEFVAWYQAQDRKIVEPLWTSDYGADSVRLLDMYAARNKGQETPAQPDDVTTQRNARLQNAVTQRPGANASRGKPVDQMTEDELWDAEAAKRERLKAQGLR